MIRSIYFALCFGLALFGLLVVTHISIPIGLSMFFIFIIKHTNWFKYVFYIYN